MKEKELGLRFQFLFNAYSVRVCFDTVIRFQDNFKRLLNSKVSLTTGAQFYNTDNQVRFHIGVECFT